MLAIVVTEKHDLLEYDYTDPEQRAELMTFADYRSVRMSLQDDLWIYHVPSEYRIMAMHERVAKTPPAGRVNATGTALLLGHGWDHGKNKWAPVGNILLVGMRLPEAKSATAYVPEDYLGLSEERRAKIYTVRSLVLDLAKHGDLSDFHLWEGWDMYKSFPELKDLAPPPDLETKEVIV